MKRVKLLTGMVLFLVIVCGSLPAQQAAIRLSPDEAVEMAVRNNLALESARITANTRGRVSDLSWNQFIPNVTVAGTMIRNNQQGTMSGIAPVPWRDEMALIPGFNRNQFEVTIPGIGTMYNYVMPFSVDLPRWNIAGMIQTSLTINIAMFENMKRLQLDYELGLLSYERAKAQLERDIRKAYHNMLLLEENIALLRASFINVERQVQMAQANFNAGFAPELVLLQAQVARENMRPVIDQAENGLRLLKAQFAMFLGLPFDADFELIPLTETAYHVPVDVTDMISRAAAGRPDVQELRQSILMMESARRALVYSLTPALTLSWNNTSAFLGDPWKDRWFFGDTDWRRSGSFTVSLGMRLHSLIPFSTDTQAVRNMEDQIRTANIGLAQLIRGTEIEIYNIVLSLERTRVSMAALSHTVSLAERSYQLTEQAYRAGLQDFFQVQNAEQSLRQARVQLLEQQFNYLNGLIDLEYLIGVPFGTLSTRGER